MNTEGLQCRVEKSVVDVVLFEEGKEREKGRVFYFTEGIARQLLFD